MRLRIGGVPEYFNLPIRRAIESGGFANVGLDVEWIDYTQGTGRMAADLADGVLDLAVLLTEGAIKAIYEGNPSKIIKTHVDSSLVWGIHTPATAERIPLERLLLKNIAISRFGSGSHLMAIHLALQLNIPTDQLKFLIVDDMEGARGAFRRAEADVFFWEKYTTKPLVDAGEFQRQGEHPTPWPAFVIAASDRMTADFDVEVQAFRHVINEYVRETRQLKDLVGVIAKRYALDATDVNLLLADLKWNDGVDFPAAFEEEILSTFETANILGAEKTSELYFV